jgi:hypothetical protein
MSLLLYQEVKRFIKVHHVHIIYDIIIQYIMYIVHVDDIIELTTWTKLRSEPLRKTQIEKIVIGCVVVLTRLVESGRCYYE